MRSITYIRNTDNRATRKYSHNGTYCQVFPKRVLSVAIKENWESTYDYPHHKTYKRQRNNHKKRNYQRDGHRKGKNQRDKLLGEYCTVNDMGDPWSHGHHATTVNYIIPKQTNVQFYIYPEIDSTRRSKENNK